MHTCKLTTRLSDKTRFNRLLQDVYMMTFCPVPLRVREGYEETRCSPSRHIKGAVKVWKTTSHH